MLVKSVASVTKTPANTMRILAKVFLFICIP